MAAACRDWVATDTFLPVCGDVEVDATGVVAKAIAGDMLGLRSVDGEEFCVAGVLLEPEPGFVGVLLLVVVLPLVLV